MRSKRTLSILGLIAGLFVAQMAAGQATRTWVSGVGDDANPCSRTAPCKTFAGAISKTAPGGEINVLDPGGFGAVTITKPITISSWGFEAGVLVSGTNGIIVNVPNATDNVILRGLDIEGLGTGISGVTVLTGGNVTIENCTINNFTVSGINFTPSVANSQLHVSNTVVRNNGSFGASTGQGVLVNPSGAGVTATLDNVRADHNVAGVKAQGSSNVSVFNSVASNNAFAGFSAAGGSAVLRLDHSLATHNASVGSAGVVCNVGTTVRLSDMTIVHNTLGAVSTGGTCQSLGNNNIDVPVSLTPVNPQ